MEDSKNAIASTHLDITVDCPYCDKYQIVTEQLKEVIGYDLRCENVNVEIICDNENCLKSYTVTEVIY